MPAETPEPTRGYAYALSAYLIWGLVLPIFLKALANVAPLEVLAHRILWALPLAVAILVALGSWRGIGRLFRPRLLALAGLAAALISVNWGVYIYAVGAGHTVEAALGYYINPLVNVALAAVFLRERPSRVQLLAIALAAVGVLVLTVQTGGLPWVSLVLAVSFGIYGLIRKTMPLDASEGFFLEVLILTPFALALALWFVASGANHFGAGARESWLLVMAGPLTAIPLILYAAGARLLRYTTIGLLQYLSPTLIALTAVFVFGEPFGTPQAVAFAFIWTALAIYTGAMLHGRRARRALA